MVPGLCCQGRNLFPLLCSKGAERSKLSEDRDGV